MSSPVGQARDYGDRQGRSNEFFGAWDTDIGMDADAFSEPTF